MGARPKPRSTLAEEIPKIRLLMVEVKLLAGFRAECREEIEYWLARCDAEDLYVSAEELRKHYELQGWL
jgi:hypothetical protein